MLLQVRRRHARHQRRSSCFVTQTWASCVHLPITLSEWWNTRCVTMCFNASMSICQGAIYLFANGQSNELSISGSILSITIQWGLTTWLWLVGIGQERLVIGSQTGWIMGCDQWAAWWNCNDRHCDFGQYWNKCPPASTCMKMNNSVFLNGGLWS